MLLLFYLISQAGASRASVITYINPAVATLLGVTLLHEHLGVGGITAFTSILLGSWLATRGAARQRAARRAQRSGRLNKADLRSELRIHRYFCFQQLCHRTSTNCPSFLFHDGCLKVAVRHLSWSLSSPVGCCLLPTEAGRWPPGPCLPLV
jgi:hypothetical protein